MTKKSSKGYRISTSTFTNPVSLAKDVEKVLPWITPVYVETFKKDICPGLKESKKTRNLSTVYEFRSIQAMNDDSMNKEYHETTKLLRASTENSIFTIIERMCGAEKPSKAMSK